MSRQLTIRNRQRTRKLDVRFFRKAAVSVLGERPQITAVDLGVFFVDAKEMAAINEQHLNHSGSTDVITFDYGSASLTHFDGLLHGEIFVCVDEAILQARQFRTTWQSEVMRYFIHGVLHLLGHDDHRAGNRRKMKQEENRLLKRVAGQFSLRSLGAK
jgi:probable rRNA maturation factor